MLKIVVVALAALAALAQTPPDTTLSPEVSADGRVTFRVRAPKASEASVFADWMVVGKSEPMKKQDDGVWSVTLGPIPQGMYIYTFTVDGVTMADPVNPRMKLRARTSASLVEVTGNEPAFWQARDVPHGSVEINWEKSKALGGETRAMWIYTPPGYEKSGTRRYPVLYLFHGSNDTAAGWTTAGNANFILDNLLAENKAVPMIVVMPFGHAVPFAAPREQQANNTVLFEQYVLQDVIPTVEGKYRVAPGRLNRAVAGLSMGGGQAINIGLSHLDLFSAVGAFSAAVPPDFDTRYAKLLNDPKGTNAQLKALWIGCGRQDSIFVRSQRFAAILEGRKIVHTFRATEGAHTFTVWRQYLNEFAPLLFR